MYHREYTNTDSTKVINYISQLANTEEFIDGIQTGNLGEVLVRYYSVFFSLNIHTCPR